MTGPQALRTAAVLAEDLWPKRCTRVYIERSSSANPQWFGYAVSANGEVLAKVEETAKWSAAFRLLLWLSEAMANRCRRELGPVLKVLHGGTS